jgi:hypothetical protein
MNAIYIITWFLILCGFVLLAYVIPVSLGKDIPRWYPFFVGAVGGTLAQILLNSL